MKKKVYQKPAMQVHSIEPTVLLQGSQTHEEKRGSLYDGIPVHNEPYEGDWD